MISKLPSVTILGSRSLARYTTGILSRGFEELGWNVEPLSDGACILAQLHGAPHSVEDDAAVATNLVELRDCGDRRPLVLLIHRPDEIATHHQRIQELFRTLPPTWRIALLGDLHLADPLFTGGTPVAIPHGFFETTVAGEHGRIVVGTHTTWGEMRAVEPVLTLLGETFRHTRSFIGYIGGIPATAIRDGQVASFFAERYPEIGVRVVAGYDFVKPVEEQPIVVVNPGPKQPEGLFLTFNVQLYHLGSKVRTGESSGSVHTRPSIPVVVEMNGAERVEGLELIKVPYADRDSFVSVNLTEGGRLVAEAITSGRYRSMLDGNVRAAEANSPIEVARRYSKLFELLARA